MALFRRNTIFHVEETLPDPEEIKLRFRRRVLLVAFVGFLVVLGVPVARELKPNLYARAEARRFTERMMEARTFSAASRMPVSLELGPDRRTWEELPHSSGESCGSPAPGPTRSYATEGMLWKLQAQQENGEPVTGHVLCWHPSRGLLIDSAPLNEGKLLLSLLAPAEDGRSEKELAAILVTQGGAELQAISY